MATHGAFSVRRRQSSSSPSQSIILFALFIFISTHHVSGGKDADSLLKFKSALENSGQLASWSTSHGPCADSKPNFNGVLCADGGFVVGLQLENMVLGGEIDVDSLATLAQLRSLSFKNNSFTGPMPDWRKIPHLRALYVSNNNFSGEIPGDSFQGMFRLKKVDLGTNQFTGMVPSSLSSLSLVELRLDNNNFTGPIPNLQQGIKIVNLANNQLEGQIPSSLANADPSAFSGNNGLCGKPLGNECNNPNPNPNATSKPKPSAFKTVIIIISVMIAIALLVLILVAFFRTKNRSYESMVTPLCHHTPTPTPQVEDLEADNRMQFKKVEHNNPNKLTFVQEDRENFDLQDLLRASAEVLGSGNFGSSFKASLSNGQTFVVKRFNQMNSIEKEEFLEHMRRLGRLQHPNLLPIVAYFYRKEEKLLVFDHVENGSLASRLHGNPSSENPSLDWATRLNIVKGVARGLLYLQAKLPTLTVAHGHLKSSNVVLDSNLNPLLMDYALNPVVNIEQVHNLLVSYRSPEFAQTGRITRKTDVWCLGILILEILTGQLPTNYVLAQFAGYDDNLAAWIEAIVNEDSLDVLDKQMKYKKNSKGEILKLLRIGATCCSEDLNDRMDLIAVVAMIEEIKEKDS